MQPYDLFQRLDRASNGFVKPMDLLNFLRDNGIHTVFEADCYYIVKFFDSDEDGKLGFMDFCQMVLPADQPAIKASATQRPEQRIGPKDYLTLDVERDATNLIMAEVKLHRESEDLKQQLASMQDYNDDSAYKSVDDWGYGYVDGKSLNTFFRKVRVNPNENEIAAIIRRLDLDADGKLNKEEFLNGIRPQEPFAKMIVREKLKKEEMAKKRKEEVKEAKEKGKKVSKKMERGEGDEEAIKVMAFDRNYDNIQSNSPLKLRVNFDLTGQYDKMAEARLREKEKHRAAEDMRLSKSIGGRKLLKEEEAFKKQQRDLAHRGNFEIESYQGH